MLRQIVVRVEIVRDGDAPRPFGAAVALLYAVLAVPLVMQMRRWGLPGFSGMESTGRIVPSCRSDQAVLSIGSGRLVESDQAVWSFRSRND
jgi:hypothetical protein